MSLEWLRTRTWRYYSCYFLVIAGLFWLDLTSASRFCSLCVSLLPDHCSLITAPWSLLPDHCSLITAPRSLSLVRVSVELIKFFGPCDLSEQVFKTTRALCLGKGSSDSKYNTQIALYTLSPRQILIYKFVVAEHVLTCMSVIWFCVFMSVHAVHVPSGSDVPALQTAAWLPPRAVQSLRGARDLPEPLRRALVPHPLRLAVPPRLCVPHLWYISRTMAPVFPHARTNACQHNTRGLYLNRLATIT